jgi:hypothetical protein
MIPAATKKAGRPDGGDDAGGFKAEGEEALLVKVS